MSLKERLSKPVRGTKVRQQLADSNIRTLVVLVVGALALSGCAGQRQAKPDGLLLSATRVFDGNRVIGEDAVLIRGQRIVALGNRESLRGRAAHEVHYAGGTILPGFIDLHVHSTTPTLVQTGITTVRALGLPITRLPRPTDRPGYVRIRSAGPIVSVAGGYPGPIWGDEIQLDVHDPSSAGAAVRALVKRGADVIKIAMDSGNGIPGVRRWPTLSNQELLAIVREAHRLGKIVTAHVVEVALARRLAAAGVDEFAHTPCDKDDATLMAAIAEQGIRIVSTLHVEGACPRKFVNARAFVQAGGDLVYGTDIGNPRIPLGLDLAELRQLRAVLGSNAATLAAATSRAGVALGEAPLGAIRVGAPADLWVVRGNPLRNLSTLASPQLVVIAGRTAYDPDRAVPRG